MPRVHGADCDVDARLMYAAPNRRTNAPARGARRADAVVDARAGRVPRHVRARVGDRRARRRPAASTRSSCGCATSPAPIPRRARRSAPRNLVACLREGAARFGGPSATRSRAPGATASLPPPARASRQSTYPVYRGPAQRRGASHRRPGATSVGHRRGRHRHRCAHGADPDRRRLARRSPPDAVEAGDRRQRPAARGRPPEGRPARPPGVPRRAGGVRAAARAAAPPEAAYDTADDIERLEI